MFSSKLFHVFFFVPNPHSASLFVVQILYIILNTYKFWFMEYLKRFDFIVQYSTILEMPMWFTATGLFRIYRSEQERGGERTKLAEQQIRNTNKNYSTLSWHEFEHAGKFYHLLFRWSLSCNIGISLRIRALEHILHLQLYSTLPCVCESELVCWQ